MSFDEIYRDHYNELRRFGRQLSLSSEASEDIIQDTFLKFYLELHRNVVFRNPRAWLYKVFLNQIKTKIGREDRGKRNVSQLKVIENLAGDIHEEYTRNERNKIMVQILDQMDRRDKEILLLYHNGFSYSEMAGILGINPNSVGKTLVRAIEKIKGKIKIQYNELFEQG